MLEVKVNILKKNIPNIKDKRLNGNNFKLKTYSSGCFKNIASRYINAIKITPDMLLFNMRLIN